MVNGRGFGPEDWKAEGLPIIRIQNLNGGSKFDYYAGPVEPRWLVEPGQLLFAWAGTKGVSFGPTIWRGEIGVLNQHIFKVVAKPGIDSTWLLLALRQVTDRIEAAAHGFKATLVHVKKSEIDNQEVLVPPIQAQRQIANVVEVWDDTIAANERLLANSRNQKQDLMSMLLRRSPTRPNGDAFRTIDLSNLFERVARKNVEGNDNVLTISAQHGLISQRDFFNKSVASRDLSGYTLLKRGEFAYNKSYSNGYPVGAIKPLLAYDAGVVSSLYLCFKFREGAEADPDFFRHYFEAGMLDDDIAGIAQEGARNHGLLNVGIAEFFGLQLRVPNLEAQRRIAKVLNTAEAEEQTIAEQIDRLRSEKRALMADLLTGKRRVRLTAAEATP